MHLQYLQRTSNQPIYSDGYYSYCHNNVPFHVGSGSDNFSERNIFPTTGIYLIILRFDRERQGQ